MAEKATVDEVFGRSIERRMQSTSVLNLFTRRALNSFRVTRIVTNFVKSHMMNTAQVWSKPENAEAVQRSELSGLCPKALFYFTSSDEEARKKHCRARCRAQTLRENYFEKDREKRYKWLIGWFRLKHQLSLVETANTFLRPVWTSEYRLQTSKVPPSSNGTGPVHTAGREETLPSSYRLLKLSIGESLNNLGRHTVEMNHQDGEDGWVADESALLWPYWIHINHRVPSSFQVCLQYQPHIQGSHHVGTQLFR